MASQRVWLSLSILLVMGCSQRAQWRVVPSPVPGPPQPATQSARVSGPIATSSAAAAAAAAVGTLNGLLFPVPGVESTRLDDSFDDPRDGGARKHNAIDIMAPRGAPVLAVQDGRVLRLSKSARGGNTMYATDLEELYVYYYAHLDRYHASLYAGKPVMRGDTLGYVGTTGNAPKDQPHLHFQVMHMPADGKFWNGTPINPYPLLRPSSSLPVGGK